MKFLSLVLAGYQRITLNDVQYFEIKPTEAIQLILGTNGSGKSSILDELTPLPSQANDYLKEGYSIKTISHNGSIYVLKSTFSPKQEHSFMKDEIELNLGGTVSVQRELVRQEFGITPEIHELLIGRTKITSMSPADRRYWFTELSNTSYEFAISYYNRIREKLRDTSGAIKLNKSRLVTETARLATPEDQQRLTDEVEDFHKLLQHLLEYRKPVEKSAQELTAAFNSVEAEILKLSKGVISRVNKSAVRLQSITIQTVNEQIVDLSNKETVIRLQLDSLYDDFSKIKESLDLMQQTENQGIEEIKNKIILIGQEQTGTLTKKKLFTSIHTGPLEALRALETIEEALGSIFLQIPSNGDKRYSRQTAKELNDKVFVLTESLSKINESIGRLETQKLHQESHKEGGQLQCPSCNFRWIKGFDEVLYKQIIENLEVNTNAKENIESELAKADKMKVELAEYFTVYRSYQVLSENWPTLSCFWQYVIETGLLFTNPKKLISDLDTLKHDLLIDKKYFELEEEIKHNQGLIEIATKVGSLDSNALKSQQATIEARIFSLNCELDSIKVKLNLLNVCKKDIEDINLMTTKLTELQTQLQTINTENIESVRRMYLNNAIRSIQSSLARKEELLNELKTQNAIIAELQKNISSLELDEVCLKAIVRELSPTDGLIAEGLFGFIKLFVDQMNAFIKKIWTYDMVIVPCQLSTDGKVELDYKFPIKVQTNEKPVPDISKGSTGMKEIIDLAFKITAMKHLGISDSPLFLDEFAATFDTAHRTASLEMMKNIIDQQSFTQLFIVNHYNSIYGALTNAEVCILCSSNIDIPKNTVYNKHVRIA